LGGVFRKGSFHTLLEALQRLFQLGDERKKNDQ
jgi:hypothetical protein